MISYNYVYVSLNQIIAIYTQYFHISPMRMENSLNYICSSCKIASLTVTLADTYSYVVSILVALFTIA